MNNARGDAPAAPSPRGPPKAAAPVADGGNKGFNVGMLQRVLFIYILECFCTMLNLVLTI